MKIEVNPPSEREFTLTLTEDEAHKLYAILGLQYYNAPHKLGGYGELRRLLSGARRYRAECRNHCFELTQV